VSGANVFHEIVGKAGRRWFSSPQFDLVLWLDAHQAFTGFELCYDKQDKEHAIAGTPQQGFRHMAVDSGEARPGKHKATPILVADGVFDVRRVRAAFQAVSDSLPREVAAYVTLALDQYPVKK
jgi:hypothetical protein